MFSFFKKIFHRKDKLNNEEQIFIDDKRRDREHLSVELCEQMIDASRELESIRDEYRVVTNYLNDIQIIEDLPSGERGGIIETATQIMNLNRVRDELLETRNRISDTQFSMFQERGEEVPKSIKLLEHNETYLAAIERDLHTLEGEKLSWNIDKKDAKKEMRLMHKSSIFLFVVFGILLVAYLTLTFAFDASVAVPMFVSMFLVACIGVYTLIHYQDCQRDIKQCDININHAITLENRVKIKYVNIKNAVDYTCEKYHVKNSKELIYLYEQYQEAVKERRKFREANDDLSYYNEKLIRQLREYHLYDARVWINYPAAICDKKELVELKHSLLVRRQKLRARIEYNQTTLNSMKKEALEHLEFEKDNKEQIETIIKRLENMNQNAI